MILNAGHKNSFYQSIFHELKVIFMKINLLLIFV